MFVERVSRTPSSKPPTHFHDIGIDDRRDRVAELGLAGFRAEQIARHLYVHCAGDRLDSWTDIAAPDRQKIADGLLPTLLDQQRSISCDAGDTVKNVYRLHDGAMIESVLMRYPDRTTVCISSQAGCGMNCPFCATGQAGLTRNLSTAEIVEQFLDATRTLRGLPGQSPTSRISNLVLMGMGEPLANYAAVIRALRILTTPAPAGVGMSARGITVSTVGLVPRMRALADEGLPVTLAVSLHAPDDELRDELVPLNARWPVAEVLQAAWDYAARTKRRISIEYALIREINDGIDRAEALADLLVGHLVHVNLIPLNPTPGSRWTASDPRVQDAFVATLRRRGIPVTVRDTRGQEIDGACGQLAATTAS